MGFSTSLHAVGPFLFLDAALFTHVSTALACTQKGAVLSRGKAAWPHHGNHDIPRQQHPAESAQLGLHHHTEDLVQQSGDALALRDLVGRPIPAAQLLPGTQVSAAASASPPLPANKQVVLSHTAPRQLPPQQPFHVTEPQHHQSRRWTAR